jgi:hypothetical protein
MLGRLQRLGIDKTDPDDLTPEEVRGLAFLSVLLLLVPVGQHCCCCCLWVCVQHPPQRMPCLQYSSGGDNIAICSRHTKTDPDDLTPEDVRGWASCC